VPAGRGGRLAPMATQQGQARFPPPLRALAADRQGPRCEPRARGTLAAGMRAAAPRGGPRAYPHASDPAAALGQPLGPRDAPPRVRLRRVGGRPGGGRVAVSRRVGCTRRGGSRLSRHRRGVVPAPGAVAPERRAAGPPQETAAGSAAPLVAVFARSGEAPDEGCQPGVLPGETGVAWARRRAHNGGGGLGQAGLAPWAVVGLTALRRGAACGDRLALEARADEHRVGGGVPWPSSPG
jgi:hypothetical protein